MREIFENIGTILAFIGMIVLSLLPVVLLFGGILLLFSRVDSKAEEKGITGAKILEKILPFLGPAMMVIGFLLATVMADRIDRRIEKAGAETTGYVTSVYTNTDSDGDITYSTTVSFEVKGETYSRTRDLGRRLQKGEAYHVRYSEEDPSEFYIDGFDRTSGENRRKGFLILVSGAVLTAFVTVRKRKMEG